jgi:hypothetical protein
MKQFQSHLSSLSRNRQLAVALGVSALGLSLQLASAQLYVTGFETSEGYPAAGNNFTTNAPVNNAVNSIPFNDTMGWTASSSTSPGYIVTTTSSGSYVGGQALRSASGSPGSGQSYIGTLDLDLSGILMLSFDVCSPSPASGAQAMIGGWYDANLDSMYNQNPETGVTGGLTGATQFGMRINNMGGTTYNSGVAPIADNWYNITLTYDFANNTALLDVFNLTANSVVDLNGASAGTTFSATAANLYGATPVNPLTYQGVVLRASGTALLDNVIVVPEPSSVALMVVGGFGMLALMRRRSAA